MKNKSGVLLLDLIETVQEQGCVKLCNGEEGIARLLEISPEGIFVTVDAKDFTEKLTVTEIVRRPDGKWSPSCGGN